MIAEKNADHNQEAHPNEREDRAALGAVDQRAAHGPRSEDCWIVGWIGWLDDTTPLENRESMVDGMYASRLGSATCLTTAATIKSGSITSKKPQLRSALAAKAVAGANRSQAPKTAS